MTPWLVGLAATLAAVVWALVLRGQRDKARGAAALAEDAREEVERVRDREARRAEAVLALEGELHREAEEDLDAAATDRPGAIRDALRSLLSRRVEGRGEGAEPVRDGGPSGTPGGTGGGAGGAR